MVLCQEHVDFVERLVNVVQMHLTLGQIQAKAKRLGRRVVEPQKLFILDDRLIVILQIFEVDLRDKFLRRLALLGIRRAQNDVLVKVDGQRIIFSVELRDGCPLPSGFERTWAIGVRGR